MDIRKYNHKKSNGLTELIALGKSHALLSKKFDPDTGEELDAEIIAVNEQELREQRTHLMEQISNIDAILADIAASKNISKN